MISLSILDDNKLFRACLKDYLLKQKDIKVEFDEEDPTKVLYRLDSCKIDIMLIDLDMSDINGDNLVKTLKQKYSQIKIIILSMCTKLQTISTLVDLGIHSYISKKDDIENLIRAIYAAYENKIYRNKLFTEALYWHNMQNTEKLTSGVSIEFSAREKMIIQLLWEEKSNQDIAKELFLGMRSIEKMRQNMKEKLGVKTTIGLLKYALNNNIIQDPWKNEPDLSKNVINNAH
jgi:DNA-binding NarL/FixJ family response regulator